MLISSLTASMMRGCKAAQTGAADFKLGTQPVARAARRAGVVGRVGSKSDVWKQLAEEQSHRVI